MAELGRVPERRVDFRVTSTAREWCDGMGVDARLPNGLVPLGKRCHPSYRADITPILCYYK